MLRVGITGGIGSGKTTVCKIFEGLGIHVFYADTQARRLYDEDEELRKILIQHYGPDLYPEGVFDKAWLSERVFKDRQQLEILNQIVHPFVFRQYETWCELHDSEIYTLKEAAILFESGSYKRLNYVITVTAPLDLRISRVMERDHISEEEVMNRIHNQLTQEEMLSRSRFEIKNDGESSLVEQVLALDYQLKKIAESSQNPPFLV